MKVVIIGAGRIGTCLLRYLQEENCELIMIDEQQDTIDKITDHYDVTGICGNGASPAVLHTVGMEAVDVVIAVTPHDETNVLACMMAKNLGASYTVARVRSNDFLGDLDYIKETLKIDLLLNPEYKAAEEMERILKTPTSTQLLEFLEGNIQVAELNLEPEHPLVGKTLRELRPMFGVSLLVPMVVRDKKTFVPDGDFVLKAGDVISVLAKKEQMAELLKKLSLVHKPVKKVMMVGCGTMGFYLAKLLEKSNMDVKIVEFSMERCRSLNEKLQKATIVLGDGIEGKVLKEEGLSDCDACVSVTGADDTNLVVSMFAWSLGVKKIITKIVNTGYADVLKGVSIDNTISPHQICAYEILQFVRSLGKKETGQLQKLTRVAENKAEVLEFVADQFPHFDVPLMDKRMKLKNGILLAAIIRDNETMLPNGHSVIKKNDRVLIITTTNHKIKCLDQILA